MANADQQRDVMDLAGQLHDRLTLIDGGRAPTALNAETLQEYVNHLEQRLRIAETTQDSNGHAAGAPAATSEPDNEMLTHASQLHQRLLDLEQAASDRIVNVHTAIAVTEQKHQAAVNHALKLEERIISMENTRYDDQNMETKATDLTRRLARLEDNHTGVRVLAEAAATLDARLTALEQLPTKANEDLKTKVGSLLGAVSGLSTRLETLKSDSLGLTPSLLEEKAAELSARLGAVEKDGGSTLEVKAMDLSKRVAALEGGIQQLGGLEATANSLEQQLASTVFPSEKADQLLGEAVNLTKRLNVLAMGTPPAPAGPRSVPSPRPQASVAEQSAQFTRSTEDLAKRLASVQKPPAASAGPSNNLAAVTLGYTADIRGNLDQLQAQIDALRSENDNLKRTQTQTQTRDGTVAMSEYNALKAQLQDAVQQQEMNNQRLSNAVPAAQHAALRTELYHAEAAVRAREAENDKLRNKPPSVPTEEHMALKRQFEVLSETHEAEQNQRMDQLKRERAESADLRQMLTQTVQPDDHEDLQKKLQQVTQEFEGFRNSAIKQEDYNTMKQELESRRQERDTFRQELAALDSQCRSLQQANSPSKVAVGAAEKEALNARVEALTMECQKLRKAHAGAVSLDDHKALQQRLNQIGSEADTLKKQCDMQRQQIEAEKQNTLKAQQGMQALNTECRGLRSEAMEFAQQAMIAKEETRTTMVFREEYDDVAAQLSEQLDKNASLQKEVDTFRATFKSPIQPVPVMETFSSSVEDSPPRVAGGSGLLPKGVLAGPERRPPGSGSKIGAPVPTVVPRVMNSQGRTGPSGSEVQGAGMPAGSLNLNRSGRTIGPTPAASAYPTAGTIPRVAGVRPSPGAALSAASTGVRRFR